MTPSERNEVAKHLIELVIQCDRSTEKLWEFLITIEAGLLVALGFLLRPIDEAGKPVYLPHAALTLVPLAGILVAFVLTGLVLLSQQWQGWYVGKFNALGFQADVFPMWRGTPGRHIGLKPVDAYSIFLLIFGLLIVVGWALVWWFVVSKA